MSVSSPPLRHLARRRKPADALGGEDRLPEDSGRTWLDREPLLDDGKQVMLTTVHDGEPDLVVQMPEDNV